jgi:acetyltransferase-like isoleucine patch superfamily enzyme
VQVEAGARLAGVHIKARKIVVRANATLTDCKIFSDGDVVIGRGATIKERTVLNAFCGITIGDRTLIDRDVTVGGMQSERSEFQVGDDSAVLHRSYLNTTGKVSIGSNAGIGGYTKIFTHSSWQNALAGGPYRFADIRIGDSVWIAWDVTIMPGVTIGDWTAVGSGAVVTKSLPARVIAAGVPARVIRKAVVRPATKEKQRIMLDILDDFGRYASGFLKLDNRVVKSAGGSCAVEFSDGSRLYYAPALKKPAAGIAVSFVIPDAVKRAGEWIELDTLTASARSPAAAHFMSFVRRYGIRIVSLQA